MLASLRPVPLPYLTPPHLSTRPQPPATPALLSQPHGRLWNHQRKEVGGEEGWGPGREVGTQVFPSMPLPSCPQQWKKDALLRGARPALFLGPLRRSESKTPPSTPTLTSMGGNLPDPCHTRSFPVTPISPREKGCG